MNVRSLLQAVRSGDLHGLEHALDAGADPNATDERGWRALGIAVKTGRLPVVERLLARGADPDAADDSGQTAVMHCLAAAAAPKRRAAQCKIALALRKAGTSLDAPLALWLAVLDGERVQVDALLREGTPVDPPGIHLLSDAAQVGQLEIVDLLLDAGAQLERPRGTRTPLLDAAQSGHLAVVQRLVARGARTIPEGSDVDAGHVAMMALRWPVVAWLERHTGMMARCRIRARVEPGPRPASWPEFARLMADSGTGYYALICVRAPIEQVAPAARDEAGGSRLLFGIETEPQWRLRNERARYITQVRGYPWTLIVYPNGNGRTVHRISSPLAAALSTRHGWRVLYQCESRYTEELELELFEPGRKVHRTDDPALFTSEGVCLPGFEETYEQGITLHGVEPDQVVRVDAFTEEPDDLRWGFLDEVDRDSSR